MKKFLLVCFSFLFALSSAWAQERVVTGKVTSADDGSTLPGVNVVLKGTTNGTVTDADGAYKLNVPSSGGTLIFSFIGMATQEVAIDERSTVDVSMGADSKQLSEVVVTAMGIESEKRSLGTSVTTLKAEAIADSRQTNVVNSLTAKMAGVRISSSGGNVGASSAIFIRGMTSFTQSNQPLFVVDGIPIDNSGGGNALQTGVSNSNRAIDLNPDDIETLNVLKGPAAAVLYGSRAISGAIIITTKKGGKANPKNSVSFTSNYNETEVNRLPDYQNTYAQGNNGIYNAGSLDSWGPKISGQTVTNYLGQQEVLKAYPDNVKEIFRKGNSAQNSLTFRGGNEKSSFIFSYSNLHENGVLKNNELLRNTFRIAANTQLTPKFHIGANVTYFNTQSRRTPIGNQQANPLFRGFFLPRSYNLTGYPFQNPDGSQTYYDATTDNPLWTIENNTYKDNLNRVLAQVDAGYDFTDWLSVNYRLGTDYYNLNIKAVDAVGTVGTAYTGAAKTGGAQDENINNVQTSSYLNITAKKDFGDFSTSLLVGNEINSTIRTDQGVTANGASVNGFGQIDSYQVYQPFNGTGNAQFLPLNTALLGIYGQATVGYKGFAFINLTGRNDWSSTFSPKNNSYFYPSISGSFVFTDAFPSLKNNKVFSFGKIRANYAKVGRTAPAFATDTYFGKANPNNGFGPNLLFPFRGVSAYTYSNALGNPDLKPEFTTTAEVGGEFKFWQDRISLDAAYFETHTTDIILAAPTSAASGFTTQQRNAGELRTNGIEIALGITPVKTANFTWDINANWTRIRNNVIKIDPLVSSIFLGGFTVPQTQLQAGQPFGVIVGNPFNKDANGNLLITSVGAGAGQPTANTAAVNVIGNPNPDWTAGITNTFTYKGIALSFLLDIRSGGDVISRNLRDLRFRGVVTETEDRDKTYIIKGVMRDPVNNADGTARALIVDGQTVPNTIALNSQNYWTSIYNTQGESIVFDASWVRLREASISYSLPKSMLDKTPFGMAQIVFTGRNLWLYAPNYPHLDPEVNSQGVNNSQGFEFNNLPQTRSYGVLLRLTF